MDFIVGDFESIPLTLGRDLMLRHVHPLDPPGKTLLHAIDPDTAVRIDVFRAYGSEMQRSLPIDWDGASFRVVAIEDLVARHARLNWDLLEGKPVAPKYARDFLRLLEVVSLDDVLTIWQEHRKPQCPQSFVDTVVELRRAISSSSHLLVPPNYSTNVDEVCDRCHGSNAFPLSDPRRVRAILGYC
jgi:hypothetical protein